MTTGNAILRDILRDGNLDAAGALADWLEEQGDARGVLLRRQYAKWKAAYAAADRTDVTQQAGFAVRIGDIAIEYGLDFSFAADLGLLVKMKKAEADQSFRNYISRKFKKGL